MFWLMHVLSDVNLTIFPHLYALTSTHWCICTYCILCLCGYCISAGHPSCGKATVGCIQCAWPLLFIQPSLAINHLLAAGSLHGKRPPDFASEQDVRFGTWTSTHTCTGVQTIYLLAPWSQCQKWKLWKMLTYLEVGCYENSVFFPSALEVK